MAKQYKCTNYGVCPEADKDTLFQEVDLEEVDGKYICPKCKQELELLEKGGGKGKGKLIGIIAAAVVVLGGGTTAAIVLTGGDKEKDKPVDIVTDIPEPENENSVFDPGTDSAPQQPAEIQPEQPVEIQPEQPTELQPVKTAPASTRYNLGWGSYEGPMQSGKPHGIGGEVKVTATYSIDLKNGSFKQVAKGDKLVNTKFKEGKLVQGYIHHANGEQESFIIGN